MTSQFLGHLLKGIRAGEKHLAWNEPAVMGAASSLVLTSGSFEPGGKIPIRNAGKGVGENISPPLAWSGAPPGTAEFILIVEDAGAPLPRPIVHAVVTSILPSVSSLKEGALSGAAGSGAGQDFALGKNTFRQTRYAGPRPVPGHGPHTYVFQLFALDRRLSFASPPSRDEVVRHMKGAVIARGRLEGVYER